MSFLRGRITVFTVLFINFYMEMSSSHGNQEITDPVEQMLKKTGCVELHYKVQECIAETKDWRKCRDVVADFKKCMELYEEKRLRGLI